MQEKVQESNPKHNMLYIISHSNSYLLKSKSVASLMEKLMKSQKAVIACTKRLKKLIMHSKSFLYYTLKAPYTTIFTYYVHSKLT